MHSMEKHNHWWTVALVLLALVGSGAGCKKKAASKVGEGGACSSSSDCEAGECTNSVCTVCSKGAQGCSCLDNGMCSATGLTCNSSNTCVMCTAGSLGCAC